MKMKKMFYFVLMVGFMFIFTACQKEEAPQTSSENSAEVAQEEGPSGEVMLYSSMQDSQLMALKEGFIKKYPNIKMDYYAAGTGKVMTKIATEQQAGGVTADMIWVGDPSNYVTFKEQGILETYESPEAINIPDKFKDIEHQFIAGRVVVMGFAYNKTLLNESEAPTKWEDLLKPEFKDQIVITDPTSSGTTLFTVSALVNNPKYGWEFFEKLKAHGAKLESGSSGTVNKVGAGAYKVCVGADHVTRMLEKQGSPLGFSYPEEDLVFIASPIAMIKDSKNKENVKLLYDFIISEAGQNILVENNTTPVHKNVTLENAISVKEAEARAMDIDGKALAKTKLEVLNKFDSIFKK